MKRIFRIIPSVILLVSILVFVGCGTGTGESYINLPEGPKILFRGGIGKITIRYTPPPDPIFRISNATDYIEFQTLKEKYGIPDKPLIIEYTVETAVISPIIIQRTNNPQFNDRVIRVLQGWIYTPYGRGPMRISVDMAKKRIAVNASEIRLSEQEPGRPAPKLGNVREMVRQTGFTVVAGNM